LFWFYQQNNHTFGAKASNASFIANSSSLIRLIYHLVKERGMTLAGARQKLKDNKETTIRQEDI